MTRSLDDDVCLCFHVSKRKLLNYIRVEKPRFASQLSECFGAGTGCGWCRPTLKRLFEKWAAVTADSETSAAHDRLPNLDLSELVPENYHEQRLEYLRKKKEQED